MNEFEKLCQQNQETVYRYLLALCRDEHLAEELTAETFYRAFLHIDRFRGECKVTTWLCQIARNAYLKEQKKRSRQAALETAFDLADAAHFTDRLCEKEQGMQIHRTLHTLKEPYREVFTLRVLGNLSYREIAGIFSKTEGWARVTFYRAKETLIQKMEEEHEN